MHVKCFLAEGAKCARCRCYSVEVGKLWLNPDLCQRCCDVGGEFGFDFSDHPIRALALDSTVPKLIHRDGKRLVSKTLHDADTILEVWGTEEQMPWVVHLTHASDDED